MSGTIGRTRRGDTNVEFSGPVNKWLNDPVSKRDANSIQVCVGDSVDVFLSEPGGP